MSSGAGLLLPETSLHLTKAEGRLYINMAGWVQEAVLCSAEITSSAEDH